MKIKLDEHLGSLRVVSRLRQAGHDVATVRQQNLTSAPDEQLIEICREEGRCLVTADRGFGNRRKYVPSNYAGIVVLRLPPRSTFNDLRDAVDTLIIGLETEAVEGKLWIVQKGKILKYQPADEENNGE